MSKAHTQLAHTQPVHTQQTYTQQTIALANADLILYPALFTIAESNRWLTESDPNDRVATGADSNVWAIAVVAAIDCLVWRSG